ncbi:hypothetical protein [Streptomyces sp. NPDC017524]|uniref:hypothetical protein n=1 Tax=Streptomyces sp. NPDC017524 TaxID=3364999 RepID=UPI0037B2901A
MDPGDRLSKGGDALTDGLVADLERLTAIPSIAFPGFPPAPVREAHDLPAGPVRGAGVERAERWEEEFRSLAGARGLLVTHLESPRPFGVPLGTATGGSTG